MAAIEFVRDDGGREAAGFAGDTRDCVTRAIAIATQQDYRTVYDGLNEMIREESGGGRLGRHSARKGVPTHILHRYMRRQGFTWTATMGIGTGCTVHVRADELPAGRLVVRCSKHVVAVIDGVLHDTHDSSREGTRCVYGYWTKGT